MTERNLSIRLSVKDSEVVRRALEGLGTDGQRALERITRAAEGPSPALAAINEVAGAGRGVMEDYAGRAGALGGALTSLGPAGLTGAAAIGAVATALAAGLHELAAAEQASLRLEAVFKATGNAAGVTSGEIEALADELEASTMASAEQVKEAAAAMATFKSVSGETFTSAVRLAQDMAAVFGGDVRSAAVQLGKALEEPEAGLTALRRAGVTFSEAEKEMIATMVAAGNTAEAQRTILAALETQLGGAGAAEGSGITGAAKHAKDAWGNLLEELAKTTGAGQAAQATLAGLASLANGIRGAIAGGGVWEEFDRKVATLTQVRAEIERFREMQLTDADPEIASRLRIAEALRKEIDALQRRGLEAASHDAEAKDAAEEGRRAAERTRNAEAIAARVKALQEDVLKHTTDAVAKRRAVEEQLTRDLATEEARRGKPGIDDGAVDRAIGLLRQRAAQRIEEIEKPARDEAERAAEKIAEENAKFDAVVQDLRRQALKLDDERAAFVDQAVSRLPDTLKGREEIVETVRSEAGATWDLINATKTLGEIEKESSERRKAIEAEGKRLYESLRTPAERYIEDVQRINELYEKGAISAETRARAVEKAHETMAESGRDSFAELKSSVEGWGRSSARYISDAFTSGERSALKFGDVALKVLGEVLEKLLYINATKPLVEALMPTGGLGLGSLFKDLFGGGMGDVNAVINTPSMLPDVPVLHDGGIAGEATVTRPADLGWFVGAPRHHDGKGPRLYPGEMPAILLEEEEVLTASDPRHSRNLGRGRMAFAAPSVSVPVTLNVTAPAGTTAKSTGARRDSSGGFTIDLLVEAVENRMSGNIARGQGLATVIEDRYQLNPAVGSFG